jgi:hypothetical protein
MRRVAAAALVLGFASTATAQPESAYYGLALGSFDYSEEPAQPFFSGVDDSTSSWRLMVGYQFLEHMAVEGALGKTSALRDTVVLGPDTIDFSTEFSMLTIRLLGVMNFDSGLTVLGGLGYVEGNQDFALTDQLGNSFSGDADISKPSYFAGVQYDLDRFAVRLAYEKYDIDAGFFREADIEETSVSFFYKL